MPTSCTMCRKEKDKSPRLQSGPTFQPRSKPEIPSRNPLLILVMGYWLVNITPLFFRVFWDPTRSPAGNLPHRQGIHRLRRPPPLRKLSSMPRASKGLLVTALLALGLQVFVLAWSRSVDDVRMISGVLTVCVAILATASAATAGCVADSYVRRFWRLTAAGFFLLSCAEFVGTYYDVVLRASLSSEWPSDVLYFLFIAPMAMTLFLRKKSRNAGFNWAQALDLFQVTILAAAVYLYYFYLPSHWQGSAAVMERLQWKFEVARDIFLIGAFALRFTFVRDRTEWSLLARLGTFLAFFCVGNVVYLYRQNAYALDAGSFWDLCYSIPIVIAIVAACT